MQQAIRMRIEADSASGKMTETGSVPAEGEMTH